jgi:hypothetical protein
VDWAKGNANIGNNNENLLVYFELRAITKKNTLPNFARNILINEHFVTTSMFFFWDNFWQNIFKKFVTTYLPKN